ncbi:L,D-transpeptidase [Panacibacter ginsenosidivorans]|uniref:L,D-transpeptidase n=1 Tax=Panacibacter ginsenosidivorans TaxID=1813871 RepID=A0A5B8VA57_9BACT|nr:L,D-transpeptidase [Panacibacter ginsenosidivorans]QEC67741.1 L,D-transpeptidase [Panacibacter ginsenosidivorans]
MKSLIYSCCCISLLLGFTSFHDKHILPKGTYLLVVEKSKYELSVYDDDGWYATYPVVFGNKDLGDKMREGDRKTPEGTFTIISKKVHEKWDRFMMLDYPTQESYQRFYERKAHGLIPQNATIGGGIGIHGTWPREDYAIDRYDNWTMGCISMKNEDVEELYNMIPVGTKVQIRK